MSESVAVKSVEVQLLEDTEQYTPYMVAKVVNATLEHHEVSKVIPPQMCYQYAKKGLINGNKGAKRFTTDEVTEFVTKYVGKKIS